MKEEQGLSPGDQLRKIARLREFSHRKSPWQDLRESISEAGAYKKWKSLLSYVRGFRTVSLLLRVVSWIFAILQTGTLVVLTTAILFILLPILLISLGVLILLTARDLRQRIGWLLPRLEGKRVYVFFSVGDFGLQYARELGSGGAAVLVLSDYSLFAPPQSGNRRYLNLQESGEGVFFIRRHFYLHLKKKLKENDVTLVF